MADIFTFTAIVTGTTIRVEMAATFEGTVETVFTETRPASLAQADTALKAHGFGRTGDWDLGSNGDVVAPVQFIDNLFNGTRAARLDDAIGTTHQEILPILAREVRDGDLITDRDQSALYVVAGSNPGWNEGPATRIHMVGEGRTWDQRYTTDFPADQIVWVARRKA